VRKLAIVLLLVVGCRRQVNVGTAPNPNAPGAASAREAVQMFMTTAKSQDIQAMSNIWGSASGSARSTMDQAQMEMRLVYMMRCLRHDSYTIMTETSAVAGERLFAVQVKRGTLTPVANFTATPGQGRWYISNVDLPALNSICIAK